MIFFLYVILPMFIKKIFYRDTYKTHKYSYPSYGNKNIIKETYTELKSYNSIVNYLSSCKVCYILGQISFLKISINTSRKKVLYKLGIPSAAFKVSKSVDILYYKRKIYKKKTRIEFHFYNEKLFLICVNFSSITENDKKKIINVLESKYGKVGVCKKSVIKNEQEHAIFIDDSVGLRLYYYCLDSDFLDFLKFNNELELKKLNKERLKHERALYENL